MFFFNFLNVNRFPLNQIHIKPDEVIILFSTVWLIATIFIITVLQSNITQVKTRKKSNKIKWLKNTVWVLLNYL